MRIVLDYDWYFAHYYRKGKGLTPDRATAGAFFPSTKYYFVVASASDRVVLAKIVTDEIGTTLKSLNLRTGAREVDVFIKMEKGDDVKESEPVRVDLPGRDCTVLFRYYVTKSGDKPWKSTVTICIGSEASGIQAGAQP